MPSTAENQRGMFAGLEGRPRIAGSICYSDDTSKRKVHKYRDAREVEKYSILTSEKNSGFKFQSLKLILFVITCCTVLSLLHSPTLNYDQLQPVSRSRFVDVGWLWQKPNIADPRYISETELNWVQLQNVLDGIINGNGGSLKIGLLNFNSTEISYWKQSFRQAETSAVRLDYADLNTTWQALYPEWIDEEQVSEVPSCPALPEPLVERSGSAALDLIAVKLPCNTTSGSWSRDVARLHLQLSAAKLAAAASAAGKTNVHVLLITDCFPIPNLFLCKNLVEHQGNAWLYKPDISRLQEKLQLPIGSCELAVHLKTDVRRFTEAGSREAYATILHSAEKYVCGAIAVAQSIRLAGSTRDLVILVDKSISDHHRSGLEAAGWKVRTIERIRNPKAERNAYNEWNYSKFRLWQLTDYNKIIFIDADLLILRNIDFLFAMPEITAIGNDATLFNSGVMVVEPSNCTFQLLMEHINEITSYNGGDQGYLNEIFTWWHRIPKQMNFLKHFWAGDTDETKAKKKRLYAADPPELYVLHYLGLKPWLCFRDYDCNWNSNLYQDFASDEAHSTWWKVYDRMPETLHSYCFLSSFEKAHLEYNRRQAETAKFPDGHWGWNVTDPRAKICYESYCDWVEILKKWGKSSSK